MAEEEKKVNVELTADGVDRIVVEIINKSNNPNPEYASYGDAGMDVRAYCEDGNPIVLKAGETKLIHTGLYIGLPYGYECQVRPRSGLALKYSITVLNSPGTIDHGYKDECCVILHNFGENDFVIAPGERIAQFIFARHSIVEFKPVEVLTGFNRKGGLGHTGLK